MAILVNDVYPPRACLALRPLPNPVDRRHDGGPAARIGAGARAEVGMVEDVLPATIDTAVIGAGHAGLIVSALLRQAGRDHVVLDRRPRVGGGWQDRWDDFCFVTPNACMAMPGYGYDGSDPDGFMPRDEIVARLARYAEVIAAPVFTRTDVRSLSAGDASDGFRLETSRGTVAASRVIVAGGGYHVPKMPPVAAHLTPRVSQLHSHDYRSEASLPPGGVLVVGSGQSGVQIAEELHSVGRPVTLAVGHCGRLPRRYRGRDIFGWLADIVSRGPELGISLPTVDELPDPRLRFAGNPHLSGHGGGHDTNLRQFAADGIRLVGRVEGGAGEVVRFAPDLAANLRFADTFFDQRFRPLLDAFIERADIAAPPDERTVVEFEPPEVTELDLAAEGISTIIWTSGYRPDFGWIHLPILDEQGMPRQDRGVSEVPGLAFVGLPWQRDQASATFVGVVRDAEYVASRW
ncbi:MAG: flavin-containing monooxygenase [Candidatus Limnocylindrales bacterium]